MFPGEFAVHSLLPSSKTGKRNDYFKKDGIFKSTRCWLYSVLEVSGSFAMDFRKRRITVNTERP